MKPSIIFDDVTYRVHHATLLHQVAAEIASGQITGLLGPSGAGKTTFLRLIAGILRPSQGRIMVLGQHAGSPALRSRLGYATQSLSVYRDLTVRENLRYFGAVAGVSQERVREVTVQVALTDYADRLVSQLSGGQQSRVSLAAALMARPEVLLLDEPTVGLDPVLRAELWHQFGELAAAGTTIVVSSHVMDEAERCDQLILLRDGKILAMGSPKDIKQQAHAASVETAFLTLVGAKG